MCVWGNTYFPRHPHPVSAALEPHGEIPYPSPESSLLDVCRALTGLRSSSGAPVWLDIGCTTGWLDIGWSAVAFGGPCVLVKFCGGVCMCAAVPIIDDDQMVILSMLGFLPILRFCMFHLTPDERERYAHLPQVLPLRPLCIAHVCVRVWRTEPRRSGSLFVHVPCPRVSPRCGCVSCVHLCVGSLFSANVREVGVGTYDAVYAAKPSDYLRDVLALMSSRGISAIPLLNDSGAC